MHRLPRVSPDVALQYKQWTIPAGVSSPPLSPFPHPTTHLTPNPFADPRWNVRLHDAHRPTSVHQPIRIRARALVTERRRRRRRRRQQNRADAQIFRPLLQGLPELSWHQVPLPFPLSFFPGGGPGGASPYEKKN